MIQIRTEQNIEVLRQVALLQEVENNRLYKRLRELLAQLAELRDTDQQAELELELRRLQEELDRKTRELYGRSTEKRPGEGSKPRQDKDKKKTGHGPREQPSLPIVEEIHELDEPDKVCPKCGGQLREMADQFEQSEEITVVRRSYQIIKHKRQKYGCRCGECVETALGPDKLIEGGRYSIDFAVSVAVAKYLDHMPLSRQARQMGRDGLLIDSQTLWDQLWALSRRLRPTYEALHDLVLAAHVVGADETRWPVLKKKPSKWWAWSISSKAGVFYRIDPSRGSDAGIKLLKKFSGVVVADGYGVYGKLARDRDGPNFTLANCWAHVRRKFHECEPNYPEADRALKIIGWLYKFEARAREEADGDEVKRLELVAEVRRKSKLVVRALKRWMEKQAPLPNSGLGKAIRYTWGLWPGLKRFLEDPEIPLDNNDVERGMRTVAVGRKNHYGSKSKRGTEVSAMFYSLIESALRAGVDPETYLKEVCKRAIADSGAVLLPSDFKREISE
jgi:transposase